VLGIGRKEAQKKHFYPQIARIYRERHSRNRRKNWKDFPIHFSRKESQKAQKKKVFSFCVFCDFLGLNGLLL